MRSWTNANSAAGSLPASAAVLSRLKVDGSGAAAARVMNAAASAMDLSSAGGTDGRASAAAGAATGAAVDCAVELPPDDPPHPRIEHEPMAIAGTRNKAALAARYCDRA